MNDRYPLNPYTPRPEHHFTFGLWTVGNRGADMWGSPVREPLAPTRIVHRLAELGAYGVNLHDDDLVPFGATAADRDHTVREFRRALAETGISVPMASTNLFSHPAFKDGAFTSNDARVRAFAYQKVMRSIDLGVELGAKTFVFWGGREGIETNASKRPQDAIRRYREAINYFCEYVVDRGYDLRFALEAKPNEPRGDLFLPTTGHMLAFIGTLDRPEMVGVNPEVAHEQMAGLDFSHALAQALDAGKLFHVDLNAQKSARFDQDLRFGSEDLKGAFFIVKLLEDAKWDGMRHFDSHPYRTEDEEGVWDFAYSSMRTYLILKAKAEQFERDPDITALLEEIRALDAPAQSPFEPKYARDGAAALKAHAFEVQSLGSRGCAYERLDQLTTELLLGVR